ncbi:hypothetical protein DXA66_12960 [Faecalibacterium sp. OF03-6AC]|nr:hypothetical protein DXA66_12960 [Faecalibacterium sp. OF03-6AC]
MKNEKWDDVHGNTTPDDRMVAFLESPTDSYAILQLREDVDDNIPLMFANYSYLQKKEMEPEIDRYEVVYHGSISMSEDVNRQLEDLYVKFNIDHPDDFRGHSMSVSDIVALKVVGEVSFHYVDSVGFQKLENFMKSENYLKNAEMAMEDDYGIMTSKSPVRSCDDVDEQALSYAEIKALCAGNPLIKEKMDLDIDVARLKVLKADHQSQQYRMEDKLLKYFPAEIEKQTGYIHGFEADIKTVEAHPQIADGFCGMEIMGKAYTEKADAGEILLAACKDTKSADPVPLGSYRGFQMELSFDSFRNEFDVTLKGAVSHRVALGTDARGNITRLDNALAGILERLERANEQLNNLYNQQEAAKAEVGKPFPQEAELTAKSQRLAELDAALNMEDSVENRDERSESERPSVLADLKSKAEHIPPAKYSETREEVL